MRSRDNRFQEFCTHLTRAECTAARTHAYHASSSRGANAEGRQMYEVSLQPCTKVRRIQPRATLALAPVLDFDS